MTYHFKKFCQEAGVRGSSTAEEYGFRSVAGEYSVEGLDLDASFALAEASAQEELLGPGGAEINVSDLFRNLSEVKKF